MKYECKDCGLYGFELTGEYWKNRIQCPSCGSKNLQEVKPPSAFPEGVCIGVEYMNVVTKERTLIRMLNNTNDVDSIIQRHSKLWQNFAEWSRKQDRRCKLNIPCGARTTSGEVGDIAMMICPLVVPTTVR